MKPKDIIIEAREARENGETTSAINLYKSLLKVEQDNLVAAKDLARLYTAESRYDEAIDAWNAVSMIDANNLEASRALARLYTAESRVDEAIDAWKAVSMIDANNLEASRALARLYTAESRVDEAIDAWNSLATIDANNLEASGALAKLYTAESRVDEAINAWKAVSMIDANNLEASGALARLYTAESRVDEAIDAWKAVSMIDANNLEASRALARLYTAESRVDEAIDAWNSLATIDANNLETSSALARLYTAESRVDEAIDAWNAVTMIDSDNPEAYVALARLYKSLCRVDDAMKMWATVLKLSPGILDAHLELARCHRMKKQFGEAIDAYRQFEKMEPQHHELRKVLPALMAAVDGKADQIYKFRHIAIAGVSYSGSTLLAKVLGSLNTVENVGETHWLTEKRTQSTSREIDFESDSPESINHCFSCGLDCKYFTVAFRKELQKNPNFWYAKIAQQLECSSLVTTDKNYWKLLDRDPQLDMDAIVLFKSPVQAWYSNYRKIDRPKLGMHPMSDIHKFLDRWAIEYTCFIREFPNRGIKLFLSFGDFCSDVEGHSKRLCEILELPNQSDIVNSPSRLQHYLGGNPGTNASFSNESGTIEVKLLEHPSLPEDHLDIIEKHERSQKVHAALYDRYRSAFRE